jgi:DNA ligase D-like protein (predicted 3'-phosphoesterase)
MPLEEYQRKRDFRKTAEPTGGPVSSVSTRSGRFVVQRHRATRLHYDFRLEIDGVLVSWAVPKGPTLDPVVRRMAVHVEDHPIEYLDFEGVIPKGEYGGGDVIVWDWGTWTAESETPDGRRGVTDGELKFSLAGEKLRGRYTIVRTSGRGQGRGARGSIPFEDDAGDQWLLIHKRDDAAVAGWDAEDHPQSVKTGRTNDEVKTDRDAIWISHAPAAVAEIDLSGAEDAKQPSFIEPMAATLADQAFSDPDWLTRSSGTGSVRPSSTRERSGLTRGLDAETYSRAPPPMDRRQAGDRRWRGRGPRREGRRISLLQTKLGQPGVGGPVYQPFDLLYPTAGALDVPLRIARLLRASLAATARAFARISWRRRGVLEAAAATTSKA